mgnify:CR=1 FL=1
MLPRLKLNLLVISTSLASLAVAGCASGVYSETTKRLANPAWMVRHQINTSVTPIVALERKHSNQAPVYVYIEGDDRFSKTEGITESISTKISNTLHSDPTGLKIAISDKAENLVYLSRPCQFDNYKNCESSYWNGREFSPSVIKAYNEALDDLSTRYNHQKFHLIGYDGGAAIATILTAQRDDILSLRTIAGVLDTHAQDVYLNNGAYDKSLNPVDFAAKTKDVPQHHFIGGQDEIVKPSLLHSYLDAIGNSNCVKYTFVQEAEHKDGWAQKWPQLMALGTPKCEKVETYNPEEFEVKEPIYVPRMTGDKK